MKDIRRTVIDPSVRELTERDLNGWAPLDVLTVDYKIKPNNKKKVSGLVFSFKQSPSIKEKIDEVNRDNNLLSIAPPVNLETSYANNFKNDYIPGQNSPTKVFKAWLTEVNLFKDNDEYFEMRSKSKTDLMSIYKSKVIDADNKYWTDMRFFASAYSVVKSNKAMTTWNIEDAYAEIRGGKRLDIPQEVYSSLPEDKGNQLQAFALKGEII